MGTETLELSADQLEDYVLNFFERDEISMDVDYETCASGLDGLGMDDLQHIVQIRLTKMKPLTQMKFIGSIEKWKSLKGRIAQLNEDLDDFHNGE